MLFSKKHSLYFLWLFGRRYTKKMHVVLNVLAYTGSKFCYSVNNSSLSCCNHSIYSAHECSNSEKHLTVTEGVLCTTEQYVIMSCK